MVCAIVHDALPICSNSITALLIMLAIIQRYPVFVKYSLICMIICSFIITRLSEITATYGFPCIIYGSKTMKIDGNVIAAAMSCSLAAWL